MIVVDTPALVDSLAGPRRSAARLRALLTDGERLLLPSLVLDEWWRRPRHEAEIAAQEALFPRGAALPFDARIAEIAAAQCRAVPRPGGREIDLAIAAHAIERQARLWTLNGDDFADVPGLSLVDPGGR